MGRAGTQGLRWSIAKDWGNSHQRKAFPSQPPVLSGANLPPPGCKGRTSHSTSHDTTQHAWCPAAGQSVCALLLGCQRAHKDTGSSQIGRIQLPAGATPVKVGVSCSTFSLRSCNCRDGTHQVLYSLAPAVCSETCKTPRGNVREIMQSLHAQHLGLSSSRKTDVGTQRQANGLVHQLCI